jgi:hypothetical protein
MAFLLIGHAGGRPVSDKIQTRRKILKKISERQQSRLTFRTVVYKIQSLMLILS